MQLRTLLIGTDLSEGARSAVQAAGLLALPGGTLHLVHVIPPADAFLPDRDPDARTAEARGAVSDAEAADRRARIDHHIRQAGLSADSVRVLDRVGRPHRVIQAVAREIEADLIVLGRHRPRRVWDGLLGSTAERVVRTVAVPCFLANRELEAPPRRLMVATDLSAHSERALRVAASWAGQWAAQDSPHGAEGNGGGFKLDLVRIADFARPGYRPLDGSEVLARQVRTASERAGPAVSVRSRVGSFPLAAEGILRMAEALESDLVFMGTHGHGAMARQLFGSVTSEIIRTAPLPIVVVPPLEEE